MGGRLRFVVQWTCLEKECALQRKMEHAQALRLCRPYLWQAMIDGEATRISVGKLGGGLVLPVELLRCVMTYRRGEETVVWTGDVPAKAALTLFDQVWTIQGKKYHVNRIGFYFQGGPPWTVILTLYWDAPELCGEIPGIATDRALKLTDPIMREVLARKLHVKLPRIVARNSLPPQLRGLELKVARIGVAITCQTSKPVRGFKTNRSVQEIERGLRTNDRVGKK